MSAQDASVGLETTWEHSWPWPTWTTLLLLAFLTALAIWIYRRERGSAGGWARAILTGLRIGALGLVVWMMYGWIVHRHRTDLPDLVIIVDDSASMATVDGDSRNERGNRAMTETPGDGVSVDEVGGGESRLARVQEFLADASGGVLLELGDRYRVKLYRAGRTARGLAASESATTSEMAAAVRSWKATEPATRLGQCVLDVLRRQQGRPTAAIVLLSDGVTTEGRSLGEAAAAARRRQIPLYCVGVGGIRPPPDIRLSELVADDVGFVGDLLTLEARLSASGFARQSVRVRLVRTDSGTVLAEQAVRISEDGSPQSLRLGFRPREKGDIPLALVAEALPGEATKENNRLTKKVTVREEMLRVLLVQSAPSFEYRFLRTLLQRQTRLDGQGEKSIELTTVLQEADPDYPRGDATAARVFPATREALFVYDVVVLQDADPTLLGASALENLAAFVRERGGGLIACAGPRFMPLAYRDTPLAELLPIELNGVTFPASDTPIVEPFAPQLTPLGQLTSPLQLEDTPERNRKRWEELPGWYWFAKAPRLRDGARVLVEHPTQKTATGEQLPLVALQFVGAGKVVIQLSDDSWRWSRVPEGEEAYARYWMQWLRWLSRSRLHGGGGRAQLTADRDRYQTGDAVRLRVRFLDERLAPSADDGVVVMWQPEGGGARSITLNREAAQRGGFTTLLDPLPEGVYRAWLATPELEGPPATVHFTVAAPDGEQTRLTLDAEVLRDAAQQTHGRYYELSKAGRLARDLPSGRQVRIESLPSAPAWNRWPFALMFVVLVTAEWLLRKRAGML